MSKNLNNTIYNNVMIMIIYGEKAKKIFVSV